MSEQVLNLSSDWQQIREEFRNHFRPDNLNIEDDFVEYKSGSEYLKIHRNRKVSGGMPLHSTEIEDVREIKIGESRVEIISEKSNYIFRR